MLWCLAVAVVAAACACAALLVEDIAPKALAFFTATRRGEGGMTMEEAVVEDG